MDDWNVVYTTYLPVTARLPVSVSCSSTSSSLRILLSHGALLFLRLPMHQEVREADERCQGDFEEAFPLCQKHLRNCHRSEMADVHPTYSGKFRLRRYTLFLQYPSA